MVRRLAIVMVSLAASTTARADEALERAKERYAAGVEHFAAERYTEAVRELEAAYALKPIPKFLFDIAKTHIKLGDKAAALGYLKRFLHEARVSDPERPTVEQMVQDLEAEVEPPAAEEVPEPLEVPGVETEEAEAEAGEGAAAPGPRERASILHTPVDEVRARERIPIVAELPAGVESGHVLLFFRDASWERFHELEMEPQGHAFVAAIPGNAVVSSSIRYYLEARDAGGRAVALSGSAFNPHIVVVQGGRPPMRRVNLGPRPPRYRGWTWAAAGTAGLFLGLGVTMAALAKDREHAVEAAAETSFETLQLERFRWDEQGIRDLASWGERFASLSKAFFVLGGVAAAGAGTLWFLDYRRSKQTVTQVIPISRVRVTPAGLAVEFQ